MAQQAGPSVMSSQGIPVQGSAFGVTPGTGSSWEQTMFSRLANMQPEDQAMYAGINSMLQKQGPQYQGTGGPMTISGQGALERANQAASQPAASRPSGPKYVAAQPGPMGQMLRMYGK